MARMPTLRQVPQAWLAPIFWDDSERGAEPPWSIYMVGMSPPQVTYDDSRSHPQPGQNLTLLTFVFLCDLVVPISKAFCSGDVPRL